MEELMKFSNFVLACGLSFAAGAGAADTLPMSWVPPSGMTPGPIAGTHALLETSPAGASMRIETSGLTPGHAITVWWVAVQSPENCSTRPCSPMDAMGNAELMNTVATNAGGAVVEADGTLEIASFLPVGAVDGNFYDSTFDQPQTAEFHLVIQDHGPLIPDLAAEMLGYFRGGCTDESVPPFYPASAMSDGQPGPNACNTAQVALFIQE
jgi:hypothetical protein